MPTPSCKGIRETYQAAVMDTQTFFGRKKERRGINRYIGNYIGVIKSNSQTIVIRTKYEFTHVHIQSN